MRPSPVMNATRAARCGQRAAISEQTPALLPLFDQLCDSARTMATPKGSA